MTVHLPDPDLSTIDLPSFLLWLLNAMRCRVERTEDGRFELVLGDDIQDSPGESHIPFVVATTEADESQDTNVGEDADNESDAPRIESLNGAIWQWTFQHLRDMGRILHAAPRTQPAGVHQLASKLFDYYTVEGGSVRLGGCTLEDIPLLRCTYRVDESQGSRLQHLFTTASGAPADPALLRLLGVSELEAISASPHRVASETADRWLSIAEGAVPTSEESGKSELIAVTVIWCKYAQGKVLFAIGDQLAEAGFGGWAKLLAEGREKPPPFQCAKTGYESYHLTTTDDGQITVPEAIVQCEASGRRVVESDLETCEVTHRRVLPQYLTKCPVTGKRFLAELAVSCELCQQPVVPECIDDQLCEACRNLQSVNKGDALMARVLAEFPRLDGWGSWRAAETRRVYILTGKSFFRRLVVVLDKETFEPLRIAEGSRFSHRWTDVPDKREYMQPPDS